MNILAVDYGFSALKVALRNPESGELIFEKFTSAVAKLTSKPDEMDNNFCFTLKDQVYCLGSHALEQLPETIQTVSSFDSMLTMQPVWISFLMNKYQKEYGIEFDKIAIGLSLAYRDRADELIQYLEEELMLQGQDKFMCFPQGTSCKKLISQYGLSLKNSERTNIRYDNYLGFDIGSNTIDLVKVSESMTSAATSIGLEDFGTVRILNMISDFIFKNTGFKIDRETAKTVQESGEFKRRGRIWNLSQNVREFTLKYLDEIISLPDTNNKVGALVDTADRIILMGGMAELIKKEYQSDFDRITEAHGYPKGYWIIPSFPCEYANAISYLLIAEDFCK